MFRRDLSPNTNIRTSEDQNLTTYLFTLCTQIDQICIKVTSLFGEYLRTFSRFFSVFKTVIFKLRYFLSDEIIINRGSNI